MALVTTFDVELFSATLLAQLHDVAIFPALVDFKWAAVGAESVNIRQISRATVKSYTGSVVYDQAAGNSQKLSFDIAKYAAVSVDDIEEVKTNINLLSELALAIMTEMAEEFDKDVVAKIVAAADASVTTQAVLTTSTAYEKFEDMMIIALENRWKPGYFVTTPAIVGMLKKDTRFASNRGDMMNSGFATDLGFVGTIDGVPVYVSNFALDTAVPLVICGFRDSVAAGMSLERIESLRLQDSFADGVRALMNYGIRVMCDNGEATSKRVVLHRQEV